MSSPTRFFITDQPLSPGGKAVLSPGDSYHAARVMRLRPGDEVEISDGKGNAYKAFMLSVRSDAAEAGIEDPLKSSESPLNITLVQSLLKGQKMDLVVRQAVELGVNLIVPLISSRSVPLSEPGRTDSRMERWQKIARSAAAQCRRTVIPSLVPPVSWESFLAQLPDQAFNLLFWENSRDNYLSQTLPPSSDPDNVRVIVGPEGGFLQEEVDRILRQGAILIGLGPRILRAETAAVAALTAVQLLLGDMGGGRP